MSAAETAWLNSTREMSIFTGCFVKSRFKGKIIKVKIILMPSKAVLAILEMTVDTCKCYDHLLFPSYF
jgi:hypothetical protein